MIYIERVLFSYHTVFIHLKCSNQIVQSFSCPGTQNINVCCLLDGIVRKFSTVITYSGTLTLILADRGLWSLLLFFWVSSISMLLACYLVDNFVWVYISTYYIILGSFVLLFLFCYSVFSLILELSLFV